MNNVNNLNVNIENSKFIKNNNNGGVIYINDMNNNNMEEGNGNDNDILIKDSLFEENVAKYFGGTFYFNMTDISNIKLISNKFINNIAGVAGAIAFFERVDNSTKKDVESYIKKMENNTYDNNVAISHGNLFASHPSKFIKINSDSDKNEISSGGSTSFKIELQDEFGNIVYDKEKYYTNIGLDFELKNKDGNTDIEYLISDNLSTFMNGNS